MPRLLTMLRSAASPSGSIAKRQRMPGSPFVDGLAASEARAVIAAATTRMLPAHSVIYQQGEPAREFFQLTSGRARYSCLSADGRRMLLRWLVSGEVLGVSALLPSPGTYRITAETVAATSLLVWDRTTVQVLLGRYPRLSQNALSVAAVYLDWYIAAHGALVSETAGERLAHILAGLVHTIGSDVADGVELQVTNEELASAANITPFTASRLLNEWQANRAVTKRRGRVVVHTPDRLFDFTR